MKRVIVPIIILCCLMTACTSMALPDPTKLPESTAAVQIQEAAPRAAAMKLINAETEIEPLHKGKNLQPEKGTGIFRSCDDAVEQPQGSHYSAYIINQEGNLELLEERQFNKGYVLNGLRYHLEFDWVENERLHSLTYKSTDSKADMLYLSGEGKDCIFLMRDYISADGSKVYSTYPVMLDLESGELTELLKNCRLGSISDISNVAIGPDRGGLLLAQEGGAMYYCRLSDGTIYSLDELSGEPVRACSLVDGAIVCWNKGSSKSGYGELGDYHFWYIELEGFTRRELDNIKLAGDDSLRFAQLEGFDAVLREGSMFAGSGYALCTNGSGQLYVLDMAAWSLSPMADYTLPASNISCVRSPEGDKLLLQDLGNDRAVVLDYKTLSLCRLDVQSARELLWLDSDSVLEKTQDGKYRIFELK